MDDFRTNKEKAGAQAPAFFADEDDTRDAPVYEVILWPNRSLSTQGFRWLLLFLAAGLSLPLIPFLGTPIAWGLLPFLLGALLAVYWAIQRNNRDGRMHEHLRLWPEEIRVDRYEANGRWQSWSANPYWVHTEMHSTAQIENYITLTGNGRTIEIGAFLAPEEREALFGEMQEKLRTGLGPAPGQQGR